MASSSVSNQALATTGSLLSIDVRMPLRKVFVKEVVPTYEAESKKKKMVSTEIQKLLKDSHSHI